MCWNPNRLNQKFDQVKSQLHHAKNFSEQISFGEKNSSFWLIWATLHRFVGVLSGIGEGESQWMKTSRWACARVRCGDNVLVWGRAFCKTEVEFVLRCCECQFLALPAHNYFAKTSKHCMLLVYFKNRCLLMLKEKLQYIFCFPYCFDNRDFHKWFSQVDCFSQGFSQVDCWGMNHSSSRILLFSSHYDLLDEVG